MITASFRNLRQLERSYPGSLQTIREFEAMNLPPCPDCQSTNTARLQAGLGGRSISIGASTTKFKLTPRSIPGKKHWCNKCGKPF